MNDYTDLIREILQGRIYGKSVDNIWIDEAKDMSYSYSRGYYNNTRGDEVATAVLEAYAKGVEFVDLGHNAYGESTLTFSKESKVRINLQLSAKEMIYPLVHELLHLNQIHEGRLSVTRFGDCVWEGKTYKLNQSKMSYKEYTQLPWELDVTSREQQLLANILQ